MEKLSLSKIKSPSGALGEIERVTVAITNQLPVTAWLDVELVEILLKYHPVFVRKVSRHYEVVSGFRAFHTVSTLLESDEEIRVRITSAEEPSLVRGALFELFSHSLMHCADAMEARERVYQQLKKLSTSLRDKYGIRKPTQLSTRELKAIMGLEGRRIAPSKRRKSELQRIMESR
ncbi:hypothetical protein HNO52_02005 [Billgrantia diversa]|uniref:hypothetical protein n=1 Tax=Halomonas sp. MCCC 1A13316 TaxID=2733487 RepID=UPI0018A5855A|nr:hypothetical protein [Halomonas sp. MCCC 1A13316]QOR37420.1 hypothetical protein HNO52_02005 [Halomonas sp. MCCC 1A13316]